MCVQDEDFQIKFYLVTHIIYSMYISLKVMRLRRSSRNPVGLITVACSAFECLSAC